VQRDVEDQLVGGRDPVPRHAAGQRLEVAHIDGQVAVGDGHPLGGAGAAGGEHQVGQVVAVRRRGRQLRRGQRRGVEEANRRVRVGQRLEIGALRHQDSAHLRRQRQQGRELLQRLVPHDQRAAVGLAQDVGAAGHRVAGGERQVRPAGAKDRQAAAVHGQRAGGVDGDQADAISALRVVVAHRPRQAAGPAGQLSVAPGAALDLQGGRLRGALEGLAVAFDR
jgi:hypothetical protein